MSSEQFTPAPTVGTAVCTCGAEADALHSITCMTVAVTQPHAMVCPDGFMFYADNEDDARQFALDFDARPVSPEVWPFGDLP